MEEDGEEGDYPERICERFNRCKFLAGGESRHWVHDDLVSPIKENENLSSRKHNISSLHRSDIIRGGFSEDIKNHRPFILESFYYADETTEKLIPYFGDFLLDSGVFTFISDLNTKANWEEYIDRYADFIKRNKVHKYFELDIDSVVGYEEVKRYRKLLEKKVGWQCIPVWHKTRGIQEYYRHCEEYPYVAIGGYVIRELKPNDFKAFPHMIRYAHKNNAKVHCLGFTKLSDLPKYHFDSVDSTAWTTGNRFGYIYRFTGETMVKIDTPSGKRLADSRQVALINYTEWIKFQRYALTHL